MVNVNVNRAALDAIQRKLNEQAQQAIRDVNANMAGEPVDLVEAELHRRLAPYVADMTAEHRANVRGYARAISDGTLKESQG